MARIALRKTCKRIRGTTLVEAAIVLEILLLITLGAIEYGWLFLIEQRITNAARHGARVEAARYAPETAGEDAIDSLFPTGDFLKGKVQWTVEPDGSGSLIVATVSVPDVGKVRLLNIPLLVAPNTLTAVVKMAKEGTLPAGS